MQKPAHVFAITKTRAAGGNKCGPDAVDVACRYHYDSSKPNTIGCL